MATTQELLTEARVAYHALMTGVSARVVVDQNGERVEYTAANRASLRAYITELENQLADEAGTTRSKGPARVTFG
jgi:hypothetical protein